MASSIKVAILGDATALQASLAKASAAAEGFAGSMQSVGSKLTSIGSTLTTHLTLPIVGIGAVAGKMAVDFQNAMELIHTQAQVPQKDIEALSKSVLKLAGPTATAPDTLAVGLFHLASQGLKGKEAIDALRVAAEGAKMGMASMEDATNALGAVMFARVKGIKDVSDAMGQMNGIVGAGDMHFQDLADAMGTKLPSVLQATGLSLKQAGAALAIFGDQNIRGAQAGTMLGSALQYMVAPSMKAEGAMEQFGLSGKRFADDLAGPGGLLKALTDIKGAMDKLPSDEREQALVDMFTKKGGTGVQILLDQLDRFPGKLDTINTAGKKFASDWKAYTETTAYHLASMGAQMQATGITIGTVLLPIVAKLADIIGNLANKFQNLSPTWQHVIEIAAGAAAAIGPVVAIVGSLITAIGLLGAALAFVADNPIVLVVAAIVALAAAIALAVLKPKLLEDALEKMGLSAKQAGEVVKGLQDVFKVLETATMALVNVIRDNWTQIKQVVTTAVQTIKTAISDEIAIIKTLWSTFGSTLTSIAKNDWNLIAATVKNGLEVIKGIFDVIDGVLHGNWSQVWNGLKEIATGAIHQIEAVLKAAVSILGTLAKAIGEGILKGILEPIAKLAGQVLSKIKSGVSSAIHAVAGWAVGAAAAIGKAITDGVVSGLGGLASKVGGAIKGVLSSAVHLAGSGLHGSGDFQWTNEAIGQPMVMGIVEGIHAASGQLAAAFVGALGKAGVAGELKAQEIAARINSILSAAASASYVNDFTGLGGGDNTGIDASATPAGKQLAALEAAHQAQQLQQALTQAQNQLASDKSSGADAATILQDQQALADAEYNIQVASLEQQAAAQAAASAHAVLGQKDTNKKMAAAVADGGNQMSQATSATWNQIHEALDAGNVAAVKKIKHYEPQYKAAGKAIGQSFADGLKQGIKLTAKAAEELAKEIAKYLPHSPAEKGPLSKPINWQDYMLMGLDDAAKNASSTLAQALAVQLGLSPNPSGLSAAGTGIIHGAPVSNGQGGGATTVNLTVHGYIGDEDKLVKKVQQGLMRVQLRGGQALLPTP